MNRYRSTRREARVPLPPGSAKTRVRIPQAVPTSPDAASVDTAPVAFLETDNPSLAPRRVLPTGTVAILSTDIVASTALGKSIGEDAFTRVVDAHHSLLRGCFTASGGTEFKETGDGFWVAFADARDAVACARAGQEALTAANRTGGLAGYPLEVRMAIHVATVTVEKDDYRGLALHDVARLLSASNGGQILVSEAAAAVLSHDSADTFTLVDRGRFLVRDAPGPVHLYDVVWEGMPRTDLPTPVAPPEREPRLPATFTRFFGREAELNAVTVALGDVETRLITLTGMGGSGKTRIALEAARQVAARFGGAVWFVPLVAVTDPHRLGDSVRVAMGLPEGGETFSALDPVLSSGPCLLVLDNLEHLLTQDQAAIDAFIYQALERYPLLTLLLTSRQRLGLSLEHEFAIRPLPTPAGRKQTGGEAARQAASVALFEDRARRVRTDFAVTDANATAVADLCRRLDGLPLAIELAAAWARLLSPAEMLVRFGEIRRSRDRDLPERHRSLQAVIETSYRLLDDEQQRAFRALSVFRGGWTVAAAQQVCDHPFTLELLADLSDRSLIVSEEREEGTTRFTFLESVREFADARLNADPAESALVTARHINHFVTLVAEAEPHLKGPEQARWLALFTTEYPNLRFALEHAAPVESVLMASGLYRLWHLRGMFEEGQRFLRPAFAIEGLTGPRRGRALNYAGGLALEAGDNRAATEFFTACKECFLQCGDERGAAMASVNLATIASKENRLDEARREYESCLPAWRTMGQANSLALVLSNLGGVTVRQGDYAAGREYLWEARQIALLNADLFSQLYALHNMADFLLVRGAYGQAISEAEICMSVCEKLGDNRIFIRVIYIIAVAAYRIGKKDIGASLVTLGDCLCCIVSINTEEMILEEWKKEIDDMRSYSRNSPLKNSASHAKMNNWPETSRAATDIVASLTRATVSKI